ncbi:MAG: PD-(D/E)XK nuclease family protein, partial [Planctomycetota bacterium]
MVGLLPLWARFDVVIRFKENGRVIFLAIDWKSGRHDKIDDWSQQAELYGLAMTRLHSVSAEQVRVLHINLQTGTQHESRFDEETLSNAAHDLDEVDDDLRYLEIQHGRSNPMAWPALPHGSSACRWCAFQKRCGREDS